MNLKEDWGVGRMTDELLIVIIIQLFIVLWELRWMWKG